MLLLLLCLIKRYAMLIGLCSCTGSSIPNNSAVHSLVYVISTAVRKCHSLWQRNSNFMAHIAFSVSRQNKGRNKRYYNIARGNSSFCPFVSFTLFYSNDVVFYFFFFISTNSVNDPMLSQVGCLIPKVDLISRRDWVIIISNNLIVIKLQSFYKTHLQYWHIEYSFRSEGRLPRTWKIIMWVIFFFNH